MSLALPSPGHQLTMFAGGGAQVRHLPALRALTIAWISDWESARRKTSTSSIWPFQKYLSVGHATAIDPILFWPSARVKVPVVVSATELTEAPSRYNVTVW